MIVDYHMHLRDAAGAIDHAPRAIGPYVEPAIARGVQEIGFTEHVYYFSQTREIWQQWGREYELERCVHDLDAYCDAVVAAKDAGLPVKLGIEVGTSTPDAFGAYLKSEHDKWGRLIREAGITESAT